MGLKMDQRGLHEWIIQRVSALLIGLYAVFLTVYFFLHQPLNYFEWHTLFSHLAMKIATFVALISVLWHAWIGLWTVFTDYVKCGYVRHLLEALIVIAFASYLAWCIDILWR